MRKFVELILFVFLLMGCTIRPKGILSDKEMEAVLYDMHMAEGVVPAIGINGSQTDDQDACFRFVLKKHGITKAQFDSSVVWYTAHPKRFDKIYPKVIKRFEKNIEDIVALQAKEKEMALQGGANKRKNIRQLNVDSLIRHTSLPRPTVWQQLQDTIFSTYQVEPPLILK